MASNKLSTYINSPGQSIQSTSVAWKHWCRLCSKDDIQGNINIFRNQKCNGSSSNGPDKKYKPELANAIEKYFMLKIQCDDEALPQKICSECVTLVTLLMKFSQQISKVQEMFSTLRRTSNIALNQARIKYGLLDEDRFHIISNQPPMSDSNFYQTKPKSNELEESLQFEAVTTDANLPNPLQVFDLEIEREEYLDGIGHDGEDKDDDDSDDMQVENINFNDAKSLIDTSKAAHSTSIVNQELTRNSVRNFSNSEQMKVEQNSTTVNNAIECIVNTSLSQKKENSNNTSASTSADCTQTPAINEKLFCSECDQQFQRPYQFRMHMGRQHGKHIPAPELKCEQCNRIFTRPSALESHIRTHLPAELKKTFPCPHCEKKFTRKNFADIHIRHTHMDERAFVCEDCGLAFRTSTVLKEHKTTHSDYAPFQCETCHNSFKSLVRLRAHMEIHSPTKHQCPICGVQLNTRSTLRYHLIGHTDKMPHKCNYCDRAFKHRKKFRKHLLIHNPGLKPYACDFCDRKFVSTSNCLSHKKKAHPEKFARPESGDDGAAAGFANVAES